MFTPCWKTCFHIVWNMFTQYSKTYLHRVERNSYSMLEDLILSCLKMHLHNVWRQFSIIFENMLTQYLETFFASCSNVCYVMYEDLLTQHFKHVWRRIHTMLADMLTQNWWHLLQICEVIFITICSKWCQLLKARQTNILKMFG